MKLVGTRIRVETSEHKTEYFPEYCLERKTWYGKIKQDWCGVHSQSSHLFGDARRTVDLQKDCTRYTLKWAKQIIDYQSYYYKEHLNYNEHQNTKQISYVKYP